MRATTSYTTQVLTPFGSGYVPERHGDLEDRNFVPARIGDVIEVLTAAMLGEVLKSLRWVLYLK